MQPQHLALPPQMPSERQRAALITLLADEDPAIYRTVRKEILAGGLTASRWLRPFELSNDPVLRRRAREIIRYFARQEADVRFLGFCLKQGEELDLERAAWQLAATARPDLCVEGYQALMDQHAAELRSRIEPGGAPVEVLGTINTYLFDELGFRGVHSLPRDPGNSYFDSVLDNRGGDAVNLCLLYLLLGRRLRLPISGIEVPGHFLCRYQSSSDEIYVDAFNGGMLLRKADCIQQLVELTRHYSIEQLSPVSPRRLLKRICANLHRAYAVLGEAAEATRVQRYLVALRG